MASPSSGDTQLISSTAVTQFFNLLYVKTGAVLVAATSAGVSRLPHWRGGGEFDLVRRVAEVDLIEDLTAETEIVTIAVRPQHSPYRVQTSTLNEQGVEEEEAWKRQPRTVDPLQATPHLFALLVGAFIVT